MAGDFPDNSRMYYSTPSDANTLYTERNWQRTRTMPVGRTDEANLNSHVNQLIAKVCNLESKFGQSYQQRNHQILQILQEDQNIQTTTAFRGNDLYCLREDLKDMFQKLKYLEIRLNKIEEVVKNVHRNQEEFKHESSSVGRGGVEYELVPRNSEDVKNDAISTFFFSQRLRFPRLRCALEIVLFQTDPDRNRPGPNRPRPKLPWSRLKRARQSLCARSVLESAYDQTQVSSNPPMIRLKCARIRLWSDSSKLESAYD